jgi:hypothetical protein
LKSQQRCKSAIYPYFKESGIENFRMMLIKEYRVVDRKQLEAYEQLWINKLKPVNRCNPLCIKSLYIKKYREDNKEQLSDRYKQYREQNLNAIHTRDRARYPEERERRITQAKTYYETNRETIMIRRKQRFDCECGGKYQTSSKSQHIRTHMHQAYINSL